MAAAAAGTVEFDAAFLPAIVDRAARDLASAKSAAEVLEARNRAAFGYDAAKRAGRLHAAKGAFNEVISACHRAQADSLEIEALANRRIADEYDAAQASGEVAGQGKPVNVPGENIKPTVVEIGLTRKQVHEAREIRDAEAADPGIVRRTLDDALKAGEEPTRAKVKRAVKAKSKRRRHARQILNSPVETQHDRDLSMLLGVWASACTSAQAAFLSQVTT